jgi:ADP-ribosyltransferase exoenzyme/Phage Mu protein F like protein
MAANRALLDATLQHSIALQRYTKGEVKAMLALLSQSEQELARELTKLDPTKWGSKRTVALLERVRAARADTVRELRARSTKNLYDLAKSERATNLSLLQRATPVVGLQYATVPAETLREVVNTQPFSGGTNAARTLGQWWDGVEAADQGRILEAIQLGVTTGEDIAKITSRVMKAADLTRANAEAVARTAVNHVSNATRKRVMEANGDVVKVMKWVSTLDGRTTLLCASRDSHYAPVGNTPLSEVPAPVLDPPNATPPAHPNCRSVLVPELDPSGLADKIGERPTVVDARTREERERDFRAEAKTKAGKNEWAKMDEADRRAATKVERDAWTKRAVGTTRASETYDEWLRRQSKEFQDEVLGPARGQKFREGMVIDQFVDDSGKTLTLEQLGAERPVMGGEAMAPPEPRAPLDFGESDVKDEAQRLAAYKAHQEMYLAGKINLNADQLDSMQSYRGTAYKPINDSLRKGSFDDLDASSETVTKYLIEQLDSAIEASAPLEQDLYVYRRGNLSAEEAKSLFGGTSPREGAVFGDLGYTSTSLSRAYGMEHTLGTEAGDVVYNFRVRLPEGMKALPLNSVGIETELLLPRGSNFRVVRVAKVAGAYEVELEALGPTPVRVPLPETLPLEMDNPPLDFGDLPTDEVIPMHEFAREEWLKNSPLEDVHLDAFSDFQGHKFEPINGGLRGGGKVSEPASKAVLEKMDEGFKVAAPLEQDLFVYRHAYLPTESIDEIFGGVAPKEDLIFTDRGFVSTSMSRERTFALGQVLENIDNYYEGAIYNFRIRVMEGTRVVYMPNYNDELEVLLNRGGKFRVVSTKKVAERSIPVTDYKTDKVTRVLTPEYEVELELLP